MSWTARATPLDGDNDSAIYYIASNGSVVIASGGNGNPGTPATLIRSLDHGENWVLPSTNPIDDPFSNYPYPSLAWSSTLGRWIASGWSSSAWIICSSDDEGDNWTQRFAAAAGQGYGLVAWAGFIPLFTSLTWDTRCRTSPDGITWTTHTTAHDMDRPSGIAVSDTLGVIIAVGDPGAGTSKPILSSTDGIVWSDVSSDLDGGQGFQVIWSSSRGKFFAVGSDSGGNGILLESSDGATWILRTSPPNGFDPTTIGLLKDDTILLTDGETGYLSSDVVTWTRAPLNPFTNGSAVFATTSEVGVQNYIGGEINNSSYEVFANGDPIRVIPPPSGPGSVGGIGGTPFWRFFISDLDGTGITDLAKIVSARTCQTVLNAPLSLQGDAPSDNPLVYLPWTDDGYDDPYLAEGVRLLWGFRRESSTPPYYTVRAATMIRLIQDTAEQDNARTSFIGYDPWHYMFSRPVCNADGSLPGAGGIQFAATQAATVIEVLLDNTFTNQGHTFIDLPDTRPDGNPNSGASGFWSGTIETAPGMVQDWKFEQGTTVGQALQQIAATGLCDIVLNPIYDPSNRPNWLVELNVYAQAGSVHDELIFAWNLPGRSLVGLDRQIDGAARANEVKFYAGPGGNTQGGATIPVQEDTDSVAKFGEYWALQAFPGETSAASVLSLAQQQLALRAAGRETVTFRPAPERSPRPWQDYNLGDRVPVWASRKRFRQLLGTDNVGTLVETQYQRIYGWTANISDDALETIDPVLVSPQEGTNEP